MYIKVRWLFKVASIVLGQQVLYCVKIKTNSYVFCEDFLIYSFILNISKYSFVSLLRIKPI